MDYCLHQCAIPLHCGDNFHCGECSSDATSVRLQGIDRGGSDMVCVGTVLLGSAEADNLVDPLRWGMERALFTIVVSANALVRLILSSSLRLFMHLVQIFSFNIFS